MNIALGSDQSEDLFGISEVAKSAGVTSRTLRHYDQIGLLTPTHVEANGYRYYSPSDLVRLQRILLLRQLGLKLDVISDVLALKQDQTLALETHVQDLIRQREHIDRQINALHHTINSLTTGEKMNLDSTFEGFNEQYKDEVITRWGEKSYKESNQWWTGKTEDERRGFMAEVKELNEAWAAAGRAGVQAEEEAAQQLASRHVQWLRSVPGTPAASSDRDQERMYILGLAEMYVADERFAKNYEGYAELVRDALKVFVTRNNDES